MKEAKKKLEALAEKVHTLESDLAVSEAENDDMVRQLEESKGLYLILDKKYHMAKNKVKELEERSACFFVCLFVFVRYNTLRFCICTCRIHIAFNLIISNITVIIIINRSL